MARLRHHSFLSLSEVKQRIRALLEEMNLRYFKQLPGNRRAARPSRAEPATASALSLCGDQRVKVNIDYHVQYQQHHYSLPHQYVNETLELHAGESLVQLYFLQQLEASHPHKHYPGTTTEAAHMPARHSKQQQWTPTRLKQWGQDIGPDTRNWINKKVHLEQAYRFCLGLLNLNREYPVVRLNLSCRIVNKEGLVRLKQIKSILRSNLDQLPEQLNVVAEQPQDHENIRGPSSFH